MKLYMFRTVPPSIVRSFSLYTQQWYMSYRFAVSKPVWHIPLLCVQWKTPDDGRRNCPKHVEFHSKNKFEKLMHPVGFIIRNLTWCTVTWMSKKKEWYLFWQVYTLVGRVPLQHPLYTMAYIQCILSVVTKQYHIKNGPHKAYRCECRIFLK